MLARPCVINARHSSPQKTQEQGPWPVCAAYWHRTIGIQVFRRRQRSWIDLPLAPVLAHVHVQELRAQHERKMLHIQQRLREQVAAREAQTSYALAEARAREIARKTEELNAKVGGARGWVLGRGSHRAAQARFMGRVRSAVHRYAAYGAQLRRRVWAAGGAWL